MKKQQDKNLISSQKNEAIKPSKEKDTALTKNTEQKLREKNLDNIKDLIELVLELKEKDTSDMFPYFSSHLQKIISRYEAIKDKYLVLFLYDENNSIDENMADKIYDAIPKDNHKPILMILHSRGGQVEPAYLISKACQEHSNNFIVVIPRRAKSAATLISLGANEIHMGSMSELGPIDPQIGKLPALSISSSLRTIAKVVTEYPDSSTMFSKYLGEKLDLRILGYFERVSESAKQYAIRLLKDKKTPKSTQDIANDLVYEYKDHSFVIDREEAKKYFGNIIKSNTEEYSLANDIHKFMSMLNMLLELIKKQKIAIVGKYDNLTAFSVEKQS